jgi:hypothetical protein
MFVAAIPHLEQHTKLAIIAKVRETQCNEKGTACTDRPFLPNSDSAVTWMAVAAVAWTRGARAYFLQTVCVVPG